MSLASVGPVVRGLLHPHILAMHTDDDVEQFLGGLSNWLLFGLTVVQLCELSRTSSIMTDELNPPIPQIYITFHSLMIDYLSSCLVCRTPMN